MTDPIRLYNPNPDAPSIYGGVPRPRNALQETIARQLKPSPSPVSAIWGSLPPQARDSYLSLANALVEMSPGAAVRDSVDAYQQTISKALEGNTWGALGGGANLLTAMAGVLPGMRIAGSAHRADNILRRPEFSKMSDEQATAAVNAFADAGERWPSKNSLSSTNRFQTQANALYPDVVPPPAPLDQARQAGRESHNAHIAAGAERAAAENARREASMAADNRMLQASGLPPNPWSLSHAEQAAALDRLLKERGIPHGRTSGAEGSRYFEIPTSPAEGAPTVKVRFADHANTSRMFDNPDFNITTGGGGNFEVGNHDLSQVIRALKGWGLF